MRTLLLAGLVSFTVLGTGGVAFGETPKPDDRVWTTPDSTPKLKGANSKQRTATEEKPPEVEVGAGCLIPEPPDTGVGQGVVFVAVKNPNEPPPPDADQVGAAEEPEAPAADIVYTVTLFKGNAEFKQEKVTLAPGAEDTVEFSDVPGGVFRVRVASDNASQETEEFELDRCKEIKPVDDALQVFSRCADGKGLVTVRVFGQSEQPKPYTITINDEEPVTTEPLGDHDYVIVLDEETIADGPFKVRVTAAGGVDTTESVNIACGTPPTTPTTTEPPAQGRPAANTGELAATGASVVWLTVAGVAVVGLGAGLFLFGRRRRATSK